MVPLFAAIAHHPGHAVDVAIVRIAEVHLRAPIAPLVLLVARVAVLAKTHVLVPYLQLHFRKFCLFLSQKRCLVLLGQFETSRILCLAGLDQFALLLCPLALIVGAPVLIETVLKLAFAFILLPHLRGALVACLEARLDVCGRLRLLEVGLADLVVVHECIV